VQYGVSCRTVYRAVRCIVPCGGSYYYSLLIYQLYQVHDVDMSLLTDTHLGLAHGKETEPRDCKGQINTP